MLLDWLDPDRERAGERLLEIRRRVTKMLVRRPCHEAEDLWDETFNRVSHKVKDIAGTYEGDPALYFYGVAKKVYQEWLKRPVPNPPPPPDRDEDEDEDVERIHQYLDKCRQKLEDPKDRDLILNYYEKEKRAKIDHRKAIADGLGVTLNTLRMRVHRINAILQKCIIDCLKDAEAT